MVNYLKHKVIGKENLRIFIRQFLKFGLVGVSNTVISLMIYYIFIFINKDWYIVGNTIGFIVSVLNAYYWNNRFVFRKTQKGTIKPLIKTYLSYGSTFLISTMLLFAMINFFNISEVIAPLINLVITTPINFLINRFWVFK